MIRRILLASLAMVSGHELSAESLERLTYSLTQSDPAHAIWTAPPSEKIFKDSALPTATNSEIVIYAARNEFEPFQVILRPNASGQVAVSMGSFGPDVTTQINQVRYVQIDQTSDHLGRLGDNPDPLWPIESGAQIAVVAGENTAFWITVNVSRTAPAGEYQSSVVLDGVTIPVRLHVFDFTLPDAPSLHSQMNVSFNTVLTKYSVGGGDNYWQYLELLKQYFIDHRLTPKAPLWPGGLTRGGSEPAVSYDCAGELLDHDGIWGFESPADKYLKGNGFNNGSGFPTFMAATFKNNDPSQDQRPPSFCGQTLSAADWVGGASPTTPYNGEWFDYVEALEEYLAGLGLLDQAYFYMANEPQDQDDYDAIAWYSQELKRFAPDLKLMVSEEPRPEIFAHPSYPGAKVDIWLSYLPNFDPEVSRERELFHDEETWVYFLNQTGPPYFNPYTIDHPGLESKLMGWLAWKYRLRGLAHYQANSWSPNPWTDPMRSGTNGTTFLFYPPSVDNTPIAYGSNNHRLVPSIRLELIRDGLEDYEYFRLLNGGDQPISAQTNLADPQVDKIISSPTSHSRDSEFLYNLRRVIGLKIGGEITTLPDLSPEPQHPRGFGDPGNYFLNFQDPMGEPSADPLIVDGKEYSKIGWDAYDSVAGYGWSGEFDQVMSTYINSGPNVLQRSILFDDFGRTKVFEFDLPNGSYDVTVSVGWAGRTYRRHKISIEGQALIDDEETNPGNPYLVRSSGVEIIDGRLTMEMGIPDQFTMLNYLEIEAAVPPAIALVELGTDQHLRLDLSALRPGAGYRVAATPSLVNANWVAIDHFVPTASTYSWRSSAEITPGYQFYRVERDWSTPE